MMRPIKAMIQQKGGALTGICSSFALSPVPVFGFLGDAGSCPRCHPTLALTCFSCRQVQGPFGIRTRRREGGPLSTASNTSNQPNTTPAREGRKEREGERAPCRSGTEPTTPTTTSHAITASRSRTRPLPAQILSSNDVHILPLVSGTRPLVELYFTTMHQTSPAPNATS